MRGIGPMISANSTMKRKCCRASHILILNTTLLVLSSNDITSQFLDCLFRNVAEGNL